MKLRCVIPSQLAFISLASVGFKDNSPKALLLRQIFCREFVVGFTPLIRRFFANSASVHQQFKI